MVTARPDDFDVVGFRRLAETDGDRQFGLGEVAPSGHDLPPDGLVTVILPSESEDPAPLKATILGAVATMGLAVRLATGGWLSMSEVKSYSREACI